MRQVLVIVPGWGGTKKTWSSCVDRLSAVHDDVRVIELPCFGEEPCPPTVWGVAEYAAFLTSRIQQIEADRIILIGHSFGGAVATRAIAENNDLVDDFLMIGAAVVRPTRRIKRTVSALIANIGKNFFKLPVLRKYKKIAQKVLYRALKADDYVHTDGIKRQIYTKIIREDQQEYLSKIQVPVHILWGAKDTLTPLRHGKKIAQQLAHSSMNIVSEGKHGLHHTHIDLIVSEVQKLINKH